MHLKHLQGIYFIRPTENNIDFLELHIKEAIFGEFFIFFSSAILNTQIQKLADADVTSSVKQIIVSITRNYILIIVPCLIIPSPLISNLAHQLKNQ